MARPTFADDPRVIRLKYPAVCRETGEPLDKGDEALWYPLGGKVYSLGSKAYRQYLADYHDMAWEDDYARRTGA